MKKLFTLFIAAFCALSVWAYDFQSGDLYYNLNSSDNTAAVTYQYGWSSDNYSGLTSVTIPETIDYNGITYKVTSIGEAAFGRCSSLTSITIPSSVKSILREAFYYCSSLTSITIPNSVKSIGLYAFESCSSLTSITIPNSVTNIEFGALYGCSSLESIVVESGNTTYDSRNNCNAIIETATNTLTYGCKNTVIPNSVTSIGEAAFSRCSSLTSITIPNSVTSILREAFFYCSSLTSVTISNNVTSIGAAAFSKCSSLTSITIPNSVTSIEQTAFRSCSSLTSITIPNRVKSIEDETFCDCSSLTAVTIGNSVTSIGYVAFSGCSSLTSITIPNSVTSIGRSAFCKCSSLDTIISLAMTPPVLSSIYEFDGYDSSTLYVPCNALLDYQNHAEWGIMANIECINSNEVTTDCVMVTPTTNDVTIIWPTEDTADSYIIVIQKGNEIVCTLTFNADGQLLNIAFAPGRNGNRPAQYAEQVANGYSFTVTSLEEGTDYTYTVTSKDSANQTIQSYSGEFTTKGGVSTDLENTNSQSPITNSQKFLRDGQLIIVRDGVEYNAIGQEL